MHQTVVSSLQRNVRLGSEFSYEWIASKEAPKCTAATGKEGQ